MNYGIFLLLGSNQGDPLRNLGDAAGGIEKDAGRIVGRSAIYKSAAWGMEAQPDFLNQILNIESTFSPDVLLKKLLAIEEKMGRVRVEKWGPRLIDIDILFFGDEVIDTPSLHIPHPGIPQRRFTLLPLVEIAPDLRHPVLGKTMRELLFECEDRLKVERVSREW